MRQAATEYATDGNIWKAGDSAKAASQETCLAGCETNIPSGVTGKDQI